MLVIAHRGANKEAIENTHEAFEKSLEIGVDRIELDLYTLKDGEVVIHHDNKIKKLFGVKGKLSKMTRPEVEKLRYNDGQKMVFLEEIIDTYLPQVSINFEIKEKGLESADRLIDLLKGHKFLNQAIISSFEVEPLAYLAEQEPHFPIALLWGKGPWVPHPNPFLAPKRILKTLGIETFHPQAEIVNERMVTKMHNRGIKVYPWVPMISKEDSEPEALWQKMVDAKVDGLCTNLPREFKAWLGRSVEKKPA